MRLFTPILPALVVICFLCFFTRQGLQAQTITESKKNCGAHDLPYPRPEPTYNLKQSRHLGLFAKALQDFEPRAAEVAALVKDKNITALQQLMAAGKLSSTDLVLHYLNRIQRYDINLLNAVMELNPDALILAAKLDEERKAGKLRGAMHGIPVLLKDNIATGDAMHTTAGAAAMLAWKPTRDAFLVKQLRGAGALILGKANLSEWANYMDPCMPSGFSVNGGQTRNPYGPFDTWGSSSGSAVSVAADLVTVSVGTETQGSIIMPAKINSVVALKTSMGLVSRDMIIPLYPFQDVPGPFGKTVADVAILLTAMTGADEHDTETKNAILLAGTDFGQYTKDGAANGMRVAVDYLEDSQIDSLLKVAGRKVGEKETASMKEILHNYYAPKIVAAKALRKAGVVMVQVPQKEMPYVSVPIGPLLEYGFKESLNGFFALLGTEAPFKDIKDIAAFNNQDRKNRAPYGQNFVEKSSNTSITTAQFTALRDSGRIQARQSIDNFLKKYKVDGYITDGQLYANAGYPAITVPSGYDKDGKPDGIVLSGGYLSEPKLLAIAAAYEAATQARRDPPLEKTIPVISKLKH